jgi:alpha/beta superfamily hydrolase
VSTRIENFSIMGPTGHLEGLLNIPESAEASVDAIKRVAVVCHPHPQYGGTMHNNVVYHMARALRERGLAVLRFNFRGVGRSEGIYDLGFGEKDDVRAALDAILQRFPGRHATIAGFSFGSFVGLQVAVEDGRVDSMLGVGIPVNSSDFSFLTRTAKPIAIVQGGGDVHGAESVVEQLAAHLTDHVHLEIIPGAGHFFPNRFDDLRAAVDRSVNYLQSSIKGRASR